MPEVKAAAQRVVERPADRVYSAVADYVETRPRLLTSHFSEYEVRAGGQGAGTRVYWRLRTPWKRVRDCLIDVSEPRPGQLVETDANSSMVTTWTVLDQGDGGSRVRVETTWQGGTGIAGLFERTFAPLALGNIYNGMLGNLADYG